MIQFLAVLLVFKNPFNGKLHHLLGHVLSLEKGVADRKLYFKGIFPGTVIVRALQRTNGLFRLKLYPQDLKDTSSDGDSHPENNPSRKKTEYARRSSHTNFAFYTPCI